MGALPEPFTPGLYTLHNFALCRAGCCSIELLDLCVHIAGRGPAICHLQHLMQAVRIIDVSSVGTFDIVALKAACTAYARHSGEGSLLSSQRTAVSVAGTLWVASSAALA